MEHLEYHGFRVQQLTKTFLKQNRNNPELTNEMKEKGSFLVPASTSNFMYSHNQICKKMIVTKIINTKKGEVVMDRPLDEDAQKNVISKDLWMKTQKNERCEILGFQSHRC